MGKYWQLLEAAFGGMAIVAAAALGIELFPDNPWISGGLGGFAGGVIAVALQVASFQREQRSAKRSNLY
jgi:hypothetical protein